MTAASSIVPFAPPTLGPEEAAISARYDEELAGAAADDSAPVDTGTVHARHLYPVLLDQAAAGISRDTLHARLRAHGISTSVHFRAVHLHPYYQERFGFRLGKFPIAESVSDTTLSLPLSAVMTETAVDRVIEACHDVLR
jgi:dTDP-4-amino-4,6-dideoxygalactose transaminase